MEIMFSEPTCFGAATVLGPDKLFLISLFLSVAFLSLFLLTKVSGRKGKITLIYTHLTFLMLPFFYTSMNSACGLFCWSCHNNLVALTAITLPVAAIATIGTGFLFLPAYLTRHRKNLTDPEILNFVKKESKRMKIKTPRMFLIDKTKPEAFSFRSLRSAIFLSVGLLDIMSRREKEAVILHELAHIKARSSIMKFSTSMMKFFSPLSLIVRFYDTGEEEEMADNYAIKIQKTKRYINSARKKVEMFSV